MRRARLFCQEHPSSCPSQLCPRQAQVPVCSDKCLHRCRTHALLRARQGQGLLLQHHPSHAREKLTHECISVKCFDVTQPSRTCTFYKGHVLPEAAVLKSRH